MKPPPQLKTVPYDKVKNKEKHRTKVKRDNYAGEVTYLSKEKNEESLKGRLSELPVTVLSKPLDVPFMILLVNTLLNKVF